MVHQQFCSCFLVVMNFSLPGPGAWAEAPRDALLSSCGSSSPRPVPPLPSTLLPSPSLPLPLILCTVQCSGHYLLICIPLDGH